jgi:hypothetical protein
MRFVRASLGFIVASGAIAALFVACGIDESGTEPADGSTIGDASPSDVVIGRDVAPQDSYVPPTCAEIDATCLGIEVPTGWVLLDVTDAGASCPGDSEDWAPHPLVANPVPTSNACSCGACTATGAYACDGSITVGSGIAKCTDNTTSIAGGSPTCVSMGVVNPACGMKASLGADMPQPTGNPTCNAPFTGTELATSTPFLGCAPQQCTTDYCGLRAQGFETCILHNSDPSGVCPGGFHNAFGTSALASVPGNVQVTCAACACTPDQPGACTASLRVFGGVGFAAGNCDGDGGTNGSDWVETLDADNCQSTGLCGFSSVYVVPDPPPPATCSPGFPTLGSGDASLTAPVTICCAP